MSDVTKTEDRRKWGDRPATFWDAFWGIVIAGFVMVMIGADSKWQALLWLAAISVVLVLVVLLIAVLHRSIERMYLKGEDPGPTPRGWFDAS